MIARMTTAALLAVTALFASTTVATADTRSHIDEVVCRLARDTDTLVEEAAVHYRNTPQYPHLITDAIKMKRLANHIHAGIGNRCTLAYLQHDVAELNLLFLHVEGLIRQIEHNARYSPYGGSIRGNTFHICRGLKLIEADIHHLQRDLALLSRPVHVQQTTIVHPVPIQSTRFNPHGGNFGGRPGGQQFNNGHGNYHGRNTTGRGNGISIQRGNVTFRFGF